MDNYINEMEKVVKKEAYPNGYIPKLHYWCAELHKNIIKEDVDMRSVHYCLDKLNYFANRQSHRQSNQTYSGIQKDIYNI